jgi:serine/alanine adding enzyme
MIRAPDPVVVDGGSRGFPATRVVQVLDEDRWAKFVAQHPDGSIFHTPEMHRVFAETLHHRPSVWATVDDDGAVHALVTPVSITTLGGTSGAFTARLVSFAGPLVADGPGSGAALGTLLRVYQRRTRRSALFTEFRNHADTTGVVSSLAACGFRHEPHLNFLIDLTPAREQLWIRIRPSARRNIRNARRLGVTVEVARTADQIDAGYELLRSVYKRIRVPLPDRSLFAAAHRILGPLARFKALLAYHDGRPIGVLTLLMYKSIVYYWYTATLREYARYRAGDLLVWDAIESGHEEGYSALDFGGAGRPDEPYGVRDFKAKFGGRLVDFGRDVWVPSPIRLRLATAGYGLVRRFL